MVSTKRANLGAAIAKISTCGAVAIAMRIAWVLIGVVGVKTMFETRTIMTDVNSAIANELSKLRLRSPKDAPVLGVEDRVVDTFIIRSPV